MTAEDLQRVANTYFKQNQRNVLIVNSKTDAEGTPSGGEDSRYAQAVQMIESATDPNMLGQMITMFTMRLDQVEDPEQRERMERLLGIANERLKELEAEKSE